MRKLFQVAAATTALGLTAGVADAATINPSQLGASCPAGFVGRYHFVNNQTGGAAAGQLTATWDSGNSCIASPSQINQSNQHFVCTSMAGALTSASTTLPGKLVLSDFTCTDTKTPPPPPPPPCDPTKEICPK